jgi:cold shock CspA family protein
MPPREVEQKWGFGMAPLKAVTLTRRRELVTLVREFLIAGDIGEQTALMDALSEVKGLFNRTVRQDQWDWYTTWTMLGCPEVPVAAQIALRLYELRKAVQTTAVIDVAKLRHASQNLGAITYLSYFLDEASISEDEGTGFLYILSTRELPDILKIGRTVRTPEKRVNEINAATGVIIPFGVRCAWRVKDPVKAEREIHALLDEWRIRGDREAFRIDFFKAKGIIRRYLDEQRHRLRLRGIVRRLVRDRAFGFIEGADGLDLFFHAYDLRGCRFEELWEGTEVEFDRIDRARGPAANNVTPVKPKNDATCRGSDKGA